MKTVTIPFDEFNDLVSFKENWQKGKLAFIGVDWVIYYSEEDVKQKIEKYFKEKEKEFQENRKQEESRVREDLIISKNQLVEVRNLRDQCAKKVEDLANSLKTPEREHWLSKLFKIRRKFR
jgi:hypothetical protein